MLAEVHVCMLHGMRNSPTCTSGALRSDFLVALNFEFNLWKWKTREVVIYFIKPVTPHDNTIWSGIGSDGGEGDAVRAASRAAWSLAKGAAAGGRGGAVRVEAEAL